MGAAEALGGLFQDQSSNAFWVGEYVIVPNPHNTPTFSFQETRPTLVIGLLLKVLAAIEFDPQLRFSADEIDDVRSHHELARERGSVVGKQPPDYTLSRPCLITQPAGTISHLFWDAAHGR